jgi:hypothetical protein
MLAESQRGQRLAETYGNAAYSYSERDPTLALRLAQISLNYVSSISAQAATLRAFNLSSWFYSERLDDSHDAALSGDGRTLAWIDDNSILHHRELSTKLEKSWKISTGSFSIAGSGNISLASGDRVATWQYRDGTRSGNVILWSADGVALKVFQGDYDRVTVCSTDIVAAREFVGTQEAVRAINFKSITADTLIASTPSFVSDFSRFLNAFSPLACTPDGNVIASVRSSGLTIFRGGQSQVIEAPEGYRIEDLELSKEGQRIAAFLRGKIDAVGLLDSSSKRWTVVKLHETSSEAEGISGYVRFLDDNRIIAASTTGWAQIVDIEKQIATPMSDRRRGIDQIAVHRETGTFIVARRSGSVTVYDKGGFPVARLVGTAPSDALNSNFSVISFSTSGNLLLTAARDGVRLWHRPTYALVMSLEGSLQGRESNFSEPPKALREAFGGATTGEFNGIDRCSKSEGMVTDDVGLLSLCVRVYRREELLATGLSIDEFRPSIVTDMRKGLDFAKWEGTRYLRLFVLNARRINDYVSSQPIWSPNQSQLSLLTQ